MKRLYWQQATVSNSCVVEDQEDQEEVDMVVEVKVGNRVGNKRTGAQILSDQMVRFSLADIVDLFGIL